MCVCLAAKSEMIKSKLPNNVLGKIWKLADVDKDGMTIVLLPVSSFSGKYRMCVVSST
jgi:hypothetical protein